MPDSPDVAMPSPERLAQYIEDHEYFWLSTDKRAYTGKDHGAMLVEHQHLFGFTDKEIAKVREPVFNKEEMKDRYLHLYELALERGWICILVNKMATFTPKAMPLAVFWFFAETHEVYGRIVEWLKSKGVTNGIVRLRTIMMRSWDAPVRSLYAGAQFSKSGTKQTCSVCGTEIGAEELYTRGTCARCSNPLW